MMNFKKTDSNFVEKKLIQQEKASKFRFFGIICRFIFGLTFIYSGFVKAIDPLGFTYKIQDYLHAMGLDAFHDWALYVAIGMAAIEFAIGLSLVSAIKMKLAAWAGLLFMLIMTPLTLWLAITNAVTDCGCFGEALVISNWQTFWKNIVLLVLIIVIIYCTKYHRPYLSPLPSWLVVSTYFVLSVIFSLVSLNHLPFIDFRPYKIGNNIPELMEGGTPAEYEVTFIYEKEGVKKEFTFEDYPWNDSTWHFVDQNSVEIKAGVKPAIHDFSIESYEDGDITDTVLSNPNYTFFFIMYDLSKTDTSSLKELNPLYDLLTANGHTVMGLTASPTEEVNAFKVQNNIRYDMNATDPITLKTIIRANPGVMVIKEGVVIDKWNAGDTQKAFKKLNNRLKLVP